MKMLIPSLVLAATLLSAVPARSAETGKTPQEIENLAEELVGKLGQPTFSEREAASLELAKLGLAALQVIDAGRKNPDLEIRTRCESLYQMIHAIDLKRRFEMFAADKEGLVANTLPLGATYEKICGKDESARKFYIELCKNNLELLDYAAENPKTMGEAYIALSYDALYRGTPGPILPGTRVGGSLSVTEIASMFLIGADEKVGPIINEAKIKTDPRQPKGIKFQPLIFALLQPDIRNPLTDANDGRYLRKLLFAWVKRRTDPDCVPDVITRLYSLTPESKLPNDPDMLEFLVDVIVSTSVQDSYSKGVGLQLLAAIVNKDQIPFIEEKLFNNMVKLADKEFTLNDKTKVTVETRVCDYALATCVRLSGQSFKEYGFGILATRSEIKDYQFAGFANDETRQAAFKKYKEWRKANPIRKDEPKKNKPK